MNYTYLIIVGLMILFDIVTGFLKACKLGEFKSSVMRAGLLSKVSELIILLLMYVLEYYLPQIDINLGLPLVQLVGLYIVIMELGSIIENIGAVNTGLQNKLSHIFADFINKEG